MTTRISGSAFDEVDDPYLVRILSPYGVCCRWTNVADILVGTWRCQKWKHLVFLITLDKSNLGGEDTAALVGPDDTIRMIAGGLVP